MSIQASIVIFKNLEKVLDIVLINPNTVAKAIQQLEQRGLVTTRIGSGTFVAEPGLRQADQTGMKAVTDRIDHLIGQCIHMGLDGPAIRRLLEDRLNKFKKP